MSEPVVFEALVKELRVKSLVSGDRGATLTLQFDSPSDETLQHLIELHRADELVSVTIGKP